MEFIFLAIGLITGSLIAWFAAKYSSQKKYSEIRDKIIDLEKKNEFSSERFEIEKTIFDEKLFTVKEEKSALETKIDEERKKSEELSTKFVRAEENNKNLNEKLEIQKSEIEELQKKFTTEFENIANKILKQNTLDFASSNQKNIGDLLNPLKEKIDVFEKKVQETYDKELRDNISLKEEVKKLFELNQKISQEANNLTKALKSDTKKQGNWGEIILERVLERSGLVKGEEYEVQSSVRNEQGDLIRPDVVVNLPESKHIVIDSKVSLIAYDSFVNSEDASAKEKFLKQHVFSIKNHIKELSSKNYQNATLFDSPDFVLLFMPIESAFSLAIQQDVDLFNFAWEKKIVIVSPTTLLATLRTVSSIWKHEKQTKNALEIARQGGSLYDKFVNFLIDLEKIGNQLDTVQKTYNEAHKKISSGSGNLISKVERIKELGAKTSKSIPEKYNLLNEEE
ncbi:MAG: DNA recombination protein RmuC [Bacteroidales bacterium]|nr:DNA recombination protein RmuC [Bacteroidales bacterium]